MTAKKIICVIGATGNQGGSVARRFLQDPRFKVRGVTRDKTSAASQELVALGAEMVNADLDNLESLKAAFKGANVIFSVTQYWEPFMRPDCREQAKQQGISCRKFAYNVEYQQGKNIADAAATTVDTLDENGFLVSTLSHARKCSNGEYTELYHFDAKADIFPDYVAAKYPPLAAKMSCIQTGYFMTSHKILPNSYFQKLEDGSVQTRFPTSPDKPVPHFAVNEDMGNFTYAVYQMPPGKNYMACGSECSWPDFNALWGKITGAIVSYKQVPFDEMVSDTGDRDLGIETAQMFAYSSCPGYDGGMELLKAEDLRKAGIECPMTTLESYFRSQDWSHILSK
ncbi:hypothetical protein N7470_005754 [Penicillium chermesinum]|nr:hypothetical protein N7470_005754 [Penicillium chermesinum]